MKRYMPCYGALLVKEPVRNTQSNVSDTAELEYFVHKLDLPTKTYSALCTMRTSEETYFEEYISSRTVRTQ